MLLLLCVFWKKFFVGGVNFYGSIREKNKNIRGYVGIIFIFSRFSFQKPAF